MSETSTLQSHAQRDFLYALAQKCTDAESTDFTIVSNGKEFKIHKVILSLHSKYFDRLFKSEYKETSQNRISLIDDPPLAVSCMVQYFYHFSYKPEPDTYIEPRPSISPTPAQTEETNPPLPSLVQVHAWTYTLAEKYDIPGLKLLAKANFTSTAHHMLQWKSHNAPYPGQMQAFYDVIPYVYSNTAPNEMGLRESIVEVWAGARKFVHEAAEKGKWLELVEGFPELGADMITGLVGDVEIGGEGYDAISCCGVPGGDDDWAADFTDRGGWVREENDESDDDEVEYPELIDL